MRITSEKGKDMVSGKVTSVRYSDAANGFSIFVVDSPKLGSVTVCGTTQVIRDGLMVECRGSWTKHPKFGKQFKADSIVLEAPKDTDSIRNFLASGLIKGVGPATAQLIIDAFGDEALIVMDKRHSELTQIRGITEEKAKEINRCWEAHKTTQEVISYTAHVWDLHQSCAKNR